MSEQDEIIDEDDEVQQQAYGRRSLGWTNKYRSVIPYEKARKSVMDLGLRSKEDWDEYVADGKAYHGPYLPNHPDKMYEVEWVSWDEFLGITRSHDETREIVQNVLKLKDMSDYNKFVAADIKRARGLRIPAKPGTSVNQLSFHSCRLDLYSNVVLSSPPSLQRLFTETRAGSAWNISLVKSNTCVSIVLFI